MKIYRRVIPKIAKDVVRTLLANQAVDVEDGRRDEAELDIAGVMVAYLDDVDQVTNDAKEALQRHQLGIENLGRIKRGIANTRNVILGDDAKDFVINGIIKALYESKYIEEVYLEAVGGETD